MLALIGIGADTALGRVVIDARLSNYLYRFSSDTGILVARPLR